MAVCTYCHVEYQPKPGRSTLYCCKLHSKRASIARWRATHLEAYRAIGRKSDRKVAAARASILAGK